MESSRPTSNRTALPEDHTESSLHALDQDATEAIKIADMVGTTAHDFAKKTFTITLSAQGVRTPTANIHIKIEIDNTLFSSKEYLLADVYQSTVWPEALRETQGISVQIAPGDRPDKPSRLALNHTFAGLLMFLDAASETKIFQLRLLDGHTLLKNEINEVLRPVAFWCRRTKGFVDSDTQDMAEAIKDRLKRQTTLVSRSDDSIDRLYSAVRMVVRATARLDHAGMSKQAVEFRDEMVICLKNMDFVEPGCAVQAEEAIQEVEKLLSRLMEMV